MKRTKCLLVVDLQPKFTDKLNGSSNYNRCLHFVKANGGSYDEVVATKFVAGNDNYKRYLNWEVDNSADLEFDCDRVIEKDSYGLYKSHESLYHQLGGIADDGERIHWDVIGCETDACIYKIGLDLFDLGYDFSVLSNFVYTNSKLQSITDSALQILYRQLGDAVKTTRMTNNNHRI